jgi:hypothetical protein
MYKFVFCILLGFSFCKLHAQEISCTESFRAIDSNSYEIIEKVGQETKILIKEENGYFLNIFNDKMELVKSSFTNIPKSIFCLTSIKKDKGTYIFYLNDSKTGQTDLYITTLTNIFDTLLRPIKWELPIKFKDFHWTVNENKSVIVASYQQMERDNDSLLISVFSINGSFLWARNIEIDDSYAAGDYKINVSNDTNVIINTPFYYSNTRLKQIKIDVVSKDRRKSYLIKDQLKINEVEHFFLAMDNKTTKANCLFTIISAGKNSTCQLAKINLDLRNDSLEMPVFANLGEQVKGIQKEDFGQYLPQDVIFSSDSSMYLLMEFRDSTESYVTNETNINTLLVTQQRLTKIVSKHFANNIYVIKLNKNFVVENQSVLIKMQNAESEQIPYLGFVLMKQRDQIVYICNDLETTRLIKTIRLNGKNEINYGSMSKGEKDEFYMLLQQGKQVSAKEILVPAFKNKLVAFMKIKF